jgi:methylmalonyl-CoA mutase cobalamin-binding domain/chain
MGLEKKAGEARHPIRVVVRRTGVPADLLRAWERRYGVVAPQRAETGRRLYSDADVEKLQLLRGLVRAGRRISDVAGLSLSELRSLSQEDRESVVAAAAAPGPAAKTAPAAAGSQDPASWLAECIDAVEQLDRERLRDVLSRAAVVLSRPRLRQDVLVPLIRTIGDRWSDGSLRIVHEHVATAVIRSFMGSQVEANGYAPAQRQLVVATPAGQVHELGALLAAAAAADLGWGVLYLGADLPAEEIAAAALQRNARAVGLSSVYPGDDPTFVDQLRKLRRYLGPEVAIFVGGQAAGAYELVLRETDSILVEDLTSFHEQLNRLGRAA